MEQKQLEYHPLEQLQGKKIYVHFVRTEADARQIVQEKKLRTSNWQGRKDRVFAVDLDETIRDDRTQLGNRVYGVVFTTELQGEEGLHPGEVFWIPSDQDEIGTYVPLDCVFLVKPGEVQSIRTILSQDSPEWR